MFGVRVSVAENICLYILYLSLYAFLCSANFFLGGGFGIFEGETFPPEVPRINPGNRYWATISRSADLLRQLSPRTCQR